MPKLLPQQFNLEVLENEGVLITLPHRPEWKGIHVNYASEAWRKRSSLPLVFQEAIIKHLVGKNKRYLGTTLFDLTGGLGRDSFLFARSGFNVLSFEENRNIFLILKAIASQTIQQLPDLKWQVQFGNFLQSESLFFEKKPSVIFIDPMFYFEKRKSLPSKEMQFLSELTDGKTTNFEELEKWLHWLMAFSFIEKILIKRHPQHDLKILSKQEDASVKKNWNIYEIKTKAVALVSLQRIKIN